MKRLTVIAVAAAALAVPSTAFAGGMGAFALHGPRANIQAGETWLAELRVVACLGRPWEAVPTVAITNGKGQRLTFRGEKANGKGRYVARVVFPSAGDWSYAVLVTGYTLDRRGPFVVRPAKQPSRLLAALPPVGAALLVLGTGLLLRRRRA
jgi:hypothetical protein